MTRGKKLLLLSAALAACAIVYAIIANENTFDAPAAGGPVAVPRLAADAITSLSYTYREETASLVRQGGAWTLYDAAERPVDQALVREMVGAAAGLTAERTFPREDGAAYGLDAPELTVTVRGADGAGHTYALGDGNSLTHAYYLTADGADTVYLVDAALKNAFSHPPTELIEKEEIPFMTDVRALTVRGTDGAQTLRLAYDSASGAWRVAGADATAEEAADTEKAEKLVQKATALTWRSLAAYGVTDGAAEKAYGLDSPALVTVAYAVTTETADGGGEALRTFAFEIGGYVSGYRYARLPGSDMVYLIDETAAEALLSATAESLAAA